MNVLVVKCLLLFQGVFFVYSQTIDFNVSNSGYGSSTTGGNNESTVYVTNLKDYIPNQDQVIPGSLRSYLDNNQSNLYINFNISGIIYLKSSLLINGCNLTINGLSSPNYPGITISNYEVIISGDPNNYSSNLHGVNIMIFGIRFLNASDDNLRLTTNAHNIIISYCSFNLALNDALGYTEGAYNSSFSFNLIQIPVPKAILISYGAYRISLHHNLFINSNGRNPQIDVRERYHSNGPDPKLITADVEYNIIWNFGQGSRVASSLTGYNSTANFIGNLYDSDDNYNAQKYILPLNNSDIYLCNNAIIQNCTTNSQSMTGINITTINGISQHNLKFNVPSIKTVFDNIDKDQNGLIDEWKYIVDNAGLGIVGYDLNQETMVKKSVKIPNITLWEKQYPWNDWNSNGC